MAPLNFSISLITFLLYWSSLSLVIFSYFPERTDAIGSHFHNVDVTSLLASSACSRQGSKTRKYSTTLEVVHKHGPCLQDHTNNKPSLPDILSSDQSRVSSIQARLKQNIPNQYKDSKASLPAQSGLLLHTGNYVINIGLGTPQKNLTLVFDTGSSLTWTQCKPCTGHCYDQKGPVYDPNSSSTYSSILCDSSQCSDLGYNLSCYTGPCVYTLAYGDNSYSVGMLSKEKLTITPKTNDVFPDFIFGCGMKNGGLFGKTAGLIGLSREDHTSFLYQTRQMYGMYFSYCLPSNKSLTGYLAFGRNKSNNSARNVKFTPLIPHPYFYRVEIVAISVGGTKLQIEPLVFQNSGTIVDSGTVITRLPPDAYVKMRDAFKKIIGGSYPTAPAVGILDTCYNITNHPNMKVPIVSFTFGGGEEVELHPSGIIYFLDSTLACFAFAGNTDPNDYTIFGNTQQRTFEMVYDVAEGKLGFGPGGCK